MSVDEIGYGVVEQNAIGIFKEEMIDYKRFLIEIHRFVAATHIEIWCEAKRHIIGVKSFHYMGFRVDDKEECILKIEPIACHQSQNYYGRHAILQTVG